MSSSPPNQVDGRTGPASLRAGGRILADTATPCVGAAGCLLVTDIDMEGNSVMIAMFGGAAPSAFGAGMLSGGTAGGSRVGIGGRTGVPSLSSGTMNFNESPSHTPRTRLGDLRCAGPGSQALASNDPRTPKIVLGDLPLTPEWSASANGSKPLRGCKRVRCCWGYSVSRSAFVELVLVLEVDGR